MKNGKLNKIFFISCFSSSSSAAFAVLCNMFQQRSTKCDNVRFCQLVEVLLLLVAILLVLSLFSLSYELLGGIVSKTREIVGGEV